MASIKEGVVLLTNCFPPLKGLFYAPRVQCDSVFVASKFHLAKPQGMFYKDAPFTNLQEKMCGLSALP